MASLKNKTLILTGATGGLGSQLAQDFASAGAQLLLIGRTSNELQKLAKTLKGQHHTFAIDDLADPQALDKLLADIEAQDLSIDILVHTVGGFAAGKPVHETPLDVWENQMRINATALYVTAGRVAKHMLSKQTSGKIIAILAKAAFKGSKNMAAYSASKAAAQRIIESMALELASHQINVNGIAPSTIDTPTNRREMPNADFSKWVTPSQIAEACLLLATNSALNGTTLELYGG